MLLLIVIVVGGLGLAWRLSFWPFDRSYKYLPKFGDTQACKGAPPSSSKPAE